MCTCFTILTNSSHFFIIRFDVIMHPVMRKLIAVKWKIYGKRGAIIDMAFNLLYTILWTIESVTMPRHGHELFNPIHEQAWRLTLHAVIFLFTLMEIKKQVASKKNVWFVLTLFFSYVSQKRAFLLFPKAGQSISSETIWFFKRFSLKPSTSEL